MLAKLFALPAAVLALVAAGFIFGAPPLFLGAVAVGLAKTVLDSVANVRAGRYALDYVAFLAMALGAFAGQELAAAIVALMFTGGEALESYAQRRAEAALRALADRIPKVAQVRGPGGETSEVPLQAVPVGAVIAVRPRELVPLDGTLVSARATLDESGLTGEPLPVEAVAGAAVASGAVNAGPTLDLRVSGTFATSTYARLVDLVERAKSERAPYVRLAARANVPFTLLSVALAAAAYALTGDLGRAVAVLVLATPCPLIIAAPVAFIGGLSAAARRGVVVKRPAVLETLAHATAVFFDKTGTLTLGEPRLVAVLPLAAGWDERRALEAAAAVEFHSIHPLARATVAAARDRGLAVAEATDVREVLGRGIEGAVGGTRYSLGQAAARGAGITLELRDASGVALASFRFADELKENAREMVAGLRSGGLKVSVLTGDTAENAAAVFAGAGLDVRAGLSPEGKHAAIEAAKAAGETVVMVGDGLNDAPALARADAGVIFSGSENSAAVEAADAVVVSRDVGAVADLFAVARRATRIARQSVWVGIGLSAVGMGFAALGFVPPVLGALIQEGIDVAVVLNAIRAAR